LPGPRRRQRGGSARVPGSAEAAAEIAARARFSLGVTPVSASASGTEAATLLRAALAEGQREFLHILTILGSTLLRKEITGPALRYLQIAAKKRPEQRGGAFPIGFRFSRLVIGHGGAEQRRFLESARPCGPGNSVPIPGTGRPDALKMATSAAGISSLTTLLQDSEAGCVIGAQSGWRICKAGILRGGSQLLAHSAGVQCT